MIARARAKRMFMRAARVGFAEAAERHMAGTWMRGEEIPFCESNSFARRKLLFFHEPVCLLEMVVLFLCVIYTVCVW